MIIMLLMFAKYILRKELELGVFFNLNCIFNFEQKAPPQN